MDETSIVLDKKSDYGWSKRGKKCHINEPNNHKRSFSLCVQ